MTNQRGFTLIELMVVVLVIGILAAIAIPNYTRMTEHARRASCFNNQRKLGEAATLYSVDTSTPNTLINVNVLLLANYVSDNLCECPKSNMDDYDDYQIDIVGYRINQIQCDIEPVAHLYAYPD